MRTVGEVLAGDYDTRNKTKNTRWQMIAYPTASQLQLSTKPLKASLPFQVTSRPAKNLGLETDDYPELEGSGCGIFGMKPIAAKQLDSTHDEQDIGQLPGHRPS